MFRVLSSTPTISTPPEVLAKAMSDFRTPSGDDNSLLKNLSPTPQDPLSLVCHPVPWGLKSWCWPSFWLGSSSDYYAVKCGKVATFLQSSAKKSGSARSVECAR